MLSRIIGCILNIVLSTCLKCPDNCWVCIDYTAQCVNCKTGYTGVSCERKCFNCLENTTCDSKNGYCREGCSDGFSGNWCNITCDSKCKACDRQIESHCTSCVHGRHGTYCEQKCPFGCFNNTCTLSGGKCTHGCVAQYWGQNCLEKCSTVCVDNICDNETGECLNGYMHDYNRSNSSTSPTQSYQVSKFTAETTYIGLIVGFTIVAMMTFSILFVCIKRKKLLRCSQSEDNDQYAVVQISSFDNMTRSGCEQSSAASDLPQSTDAGHKDTVHPILHIDVHNASYNTTTENEMLEINPEEAHTKDVECAGCFEEEEAYYNTAALIKRKIAIDNLENYVNQKTTKGFVDEFKELPPGLLKPYTESQKKENVKKNRYRGFYPYDQTRVVIKEGDSDFINASYIDGYRAFRAYIASLGPTNEFMGDLSVFWRMIWQENCGKIVMLTNLQESQVCKCDKYWPDKGLTDLYADFIVSCHKEVKRKHYIVRGFSIQKNMEKRDIVQFHFTAWPDKGIPADVQSLVTFRQEVNNYNSELNGPVLVHCSAGVGRTGTYIALDMLTREGEDEGGIDVFACVRNLREQRVKMVQTAEQYEYLHNALVYSLNKQPVYASCVRKNSQAACAPSEENNM